MKTPGPNEPLYTEKEVNAILRRASELQSDDRPTGSTLSSVKQAASELGIDPELIDRAARELSNSSSASIDGAGSKLFGGPWTVDTVRTVPRITENEWATIVEKIRSASGRVGYPKQVGAGFEWLSQRPEPIHVTLTPKGGKTELRVRAWFGHWALAFYIIPSTLAVTAVLFAYLAAGGAGVAPQDVLISGLLGAPVLGVILGRIAAGRFFKKKCAEARALAVVIERAIVEEAAAVCEPTLLEAPITTPVVQIARYQLESEHDMEEQVQELKLS